ncbi:MAG: hypothetical protein LC795_15615 [Acidobacteria bacterium]|nr:hypothetical protein [Acidobacteriota bacterium]MCA1620703.1 hypothetical protein [Acidobacteriota bacterium]
MTEAERAAKALERQRAKILGASATLTLYDNAGAALVTLSHSFFVYRKSDLVLGEEYHLAEIAEVAGMTPAAAARVKTAKLSTTGSTFNVTQVEDPVGAARTWKLRMSPFKKS